MRYRFVGLPAAPFTPLLELNDRELMARGMRRVVADAKPGYPCRITLEDADPGERLLLIPFEHQPAHSPYRASGPIFVREGAGKTFDHVGDPPPVFQNRVLSVRGYAEDGMMVDAEVAPSEELETVLDRVFSDTSIAYAHIHFAKRGCFAARVERAG